MLVITLHAFTSEVEVYTYKGRQFEKKRRMVCHFANAKLFVKIVLSVAALAELFTWENLIPGTDISL